MGTKTPDFALLLASSVHDIKNSLGMLMNSLEELITENEAQSDSQRHNYSVLKGEASRINNALINLLGLYKLQENHLSVDIDEVFVAEFLEEQIASQQLLFDVNHIEIDLQCDDNLSAFFDDNLISGVITNILVNCAKYTKDHITISARYKNEYLLIEVTDNGRGYPSAIIDSFEHTENKVDFNSGSTNLGLYFAQRIANLHKNKGRNGYITLSNLDQGGGCFRLYLP